jgi:hypothetical protein
MTSKKSAKKFLVFGILGLFMISMMAGVLAAKPGPTGADEIGFTISSFFVGFVKGFGEIGKDPNLFILLFAILLAMIVYSVIEVIFKTNSFTRWVATAAITGLGVFAIPANFLEIITTQYGVMGATILTAIPFAIVAFFTMKAENELVSKATWVFFVMYYFSILIAELIRVATLTSIATTSTFLSKLFTTTLLFEPTVLPYTMALIAGVIMLLFLSRLRELFFRSILTSQANAARRRRESRSQAERLRDEEARETLNPAD